MMRNARLLAGALLLAAVSLQAAHAQQGGRASDAKTGSETVAVSEFIGRELINARGESLGTISEVVFDARTGALVSVASGSLAFPADDLRPQGERYELRSKYEPRTFAEPQWPAMRASTLLDREVVDRLHRDFGEIRDLVIDLRAPEVRSAVVDRRDDWAAGQSLVTLPLEAFSLPRDLPDKVAINYSRERYE